MGRYLTEEEFKKRIEAQDAFFEAIKSNDFDAMAEAASKLKFDAEYLQAVKETHGPEFIRRWRLDISAAEDAYGKGWLDR